MHGENLKLIHTFLITECFSVAVITKTLILRLALCILKRHCVINFVLFAGSKAPTVGHKDCGKMNLHHSITEKKVLTEIKSTWHVTFSVLCLQTSCMLSSHVPHILMQLYFKK